MATWTWNPSDKDPQITLSDGDLTATAAAGTAYSGVRATQYKSSGKWYWEITVTATGMNSVEEIAAVCDSSAVMTEPIGRDTHGWSWRGDNQYFYNNSTTACGVYYNSGDIVHVALDMDNGKIWFGKNGAWNGSGDPAAGTNYAFTGITGNIYPVTSHYYSGACTVNFGASAFTYTVPDGFLGISIIGDSTTETLTLTDTAEALHLVDSTTETATVTDVVEELHLVEAIAETATVTDAITPALEIERSLAETATVTDLVEELHLVETIPEIATVTDAVANERTAYGATSETATITDEITPLHLVDATSETTSVTDLVEPDDLIRKKIKFPNLQGKHLSLKFTSATDGSFAIYYLRHKMFKTRELTSDQKHPNTQGSHIGIKLSNSGSDAFTLMYVSEEMQLVTT